MKFSTANARPALVQEGAMGRQAAGAVAAGRSGFVVVAMAALVCLALALAGLVAQPGQAHAALKAAASSTIKTYTITSGNTQVYSNTGLTKKYGTIYGSDEVKVLSVTDKYCRVTYPVKGGTKTGYVRTSAILTKTTGSTYTSRAKVTAYRRPGGASYGYIAKGDAVKVLGTSGGYTQVKYPVSGGYKYAFITTSNYNSYIKPASTPMTTPTTARTNLSYALYKNSRAYVSCGFDGYRSTSGRHEGIDVKCYNGAPVYSLTDGVVVRVAGGWCGSSGLSTIAIYNSASNKTVIYLHSAPYGVKAGQTVKKGQRIASESWRGISSSSGSHTHVEVRNGRQSYAAKSVGDYVLNNSNPTSFWQSQGYNVK